MDVVNDASEGGEGRERGARSIKQSNASKGFTRAHSLNRQTACLLVPRMLVVEFLHPTICSKEREKQNLLEHASSISCEKSCKLIPMELIVTGYLLNCIIKLKFHS